MCVCVIKAGSPRSLKYNESGGQISQYYNNKIF